MNNQEILEALKKSVAMPPVLCMNERSVISADTMKEAVKQVLKKEGVWK